MALADTAKLIVNLSLGGNFASGISKATRDLQKFDRAASNTGTRAYKAGQQIGTGIKNLAKISVVAATGIAAVAAASVRAAGDFEAQLNTINTVARQTPEALGKIGDAIRQIARDTGTTTDDLTQGYYDLVSAGIKAADATQVLANANKLAIGGLATTTQTVDLLTTAINVYGGDAQNAAKFTDIFAKAIERGKVTAAELSSNFAIVGQVAANSGIEIEEIGAAFARLTAGGTAAGEAATQMRSALIGLTRTTKPLEKLQKETGRNYLKIAGRKGLVFALQQLRTDADKAGVPLIELLGRVEGFNFALATTGPNFDAYNADLAAMGAAAGTASAQMAERQKGLNFQLARLKALAKDAGISIGSALLPKLTPLLDRLNKFVAGTEGQKAISDLGTALAGLFTDENITAGVNALKEGFAIAKDAAPAIAGAAKITGAALKVAVDAFNALPEGVKAIAIAGLAVNKLTGGLVTNLAGGLIGAVLKSFGGRMFVTAGVVQVSGPVAGMPGGGGGGIGLLGAATLGGAAAIGSKAVADFTNAEFSNAGFAKTDFVGPGSGDPFGITSTFHNLGEVLKLVTQRKPATQGSLDRPRNVGPGGARDAEAQRKAIEKVQTQVESMKGKIAAELATNKKAVDDSKSKITAAQQETKRETARGDALVRAQTQSSGSQIVAAIVANRPIINNNITVSPTTINRVTTVTNRYGTQIGSSGQDAFDGTRPR